MKLVHAIYEPAGDGPFPTIFAMHGWGLSAFDLHGIAPFIAGGRFLVICPQGPHEVEIGAINGYGWYEMNPGGKPNEEKIDAAVDELRAFINEACGRYPVDRSKIVLAGFSQGGMMAYNLAMRWPDKFAALVGIGTAFPEFLAERATNREAIEASHAGAAWTGRRRDRHAAGAQIRRNAARTGGAGDVPRVRLPSRNLRRRHTRSFRLSGGKSSRS